MKEEKFFLNAEDGVKIVCFKWSSETQNDPKAVIQLIHGSVEHVSRYKPLAQELVKNGYLVYGSDQRGHGETAGSVEKLSYFSDINEGWEMSRDELHNLTNVIKDENKGKKIFLLGHSMGSFLLRDYLSQYGSEIDGAILSGTGGGKVALVKTATLLTKIMILFRGRKSLSPFMHNMIYGALNNEMKNPRTDYDFLSRDEAEVDKYINDPFCGNTVSLNYALEMTRGLERIQKKNSYQNTPDNLPLYLFSGENDPVGGINSKEVKAVYENYKSSGISDLEFKLYPDGRHEMLNEINRHEVFNDIITWIEKRV